MAYDAATGQLVLLSGNNFTSDTWKIDGSPAGCTTACSWWHPSVCPLLLIRLLDTNGRVQC
jgi:hypothetical protein